MNQRVPPLSRFMPKRSTPMKWNARAAFFCTKDLTISVGVELMESWCYGSWSCGVGSKGVFLTAVDFIRGVKEEVVNCLETYKYHHVSGGSEWITIVTSQHTVVVWLPTKYVQARHFIWDQQEYDRRNHSLTPSSQLAWKQGLELICLWTWFPALDLASFLGHL